MARSSSRIRAFGGRIGLVAIVASCGYAASQGQFATFATLGAVCGAWLVLLSWAPMSTGVRAMAARLTLLVSIAYASLFALEVALTWRDRSDPFAIAESTRGMCTQDEALGYRLTPGWNGTYFDTVISLPLRINALGHRDELPEDGMIAAPLLLLGDSFAFGQGLPRPETIQARVEAHSAGAVRMYSAGAPGWGAPQALHQLRTLPWRGRAAVYLFFQNDMHWHNVDPTSYGVQDGYTILRKRPDGSSVTPAEIAEIITAFHGDQDPWIKFRERLRLRVELTAVRSAIAAIGDTNLRMLGSPSDEYHPEARAAVVADVLRMRQLADERGFDLHVVFAPTHAEVASARWAPADEAMIADMHAAGIEPALELLSRLSDDDYLPHDGHFGPTGADVAARYILELTSSSP